MPGDAKYFIYTLTLQPCRIILTFKIENLRVRKKICLILHRARNEVGLSSFDVNLHSSIVSYSGNPELFHNAQTLPERNVHCIPRLPVEESK